MVPNLTLMDVRALVDTPLTPLTTPCFLRLHFLPPTLAYSNRVYHRPALSRQITQAKKFVEGVPKVLKENVTKEDAEKLQKAFEALGAVVKLE